MCRQARIFLDTSNATKPAPASRPAALPSLARKSHDQREPLGVSPPALSDQSEVNRR